MDFHGALLETIKNIEEINKYLASDNGQYYLREISNLETKINNTQRDIELELNVEINEKSINLNKITLRKLINNFISQIPALSKYKIEDILK